MPKFTLLPVKNLYADEIEEMEKTIKQVYKEFELIQIEIDHKQKASNDLFHRDEFPYLIINGFSNGLKYQKHTMSYHKSLGKKIDRRLKFKDLDVIFELKTQLQILHNDADNFYKNFYNEQHEKLTFLRVDLSKVNVKKHDLVFEAQQKIEMFLGIQKISILSILDLLQSRIQMINEAIESNISEIIKNFDTKDLIKDGIAIQEDFGKENKILLEVLWNGTKAEALYLLYCLQQLTKYMTKIYNRFQNL